MWPHETKFHMEERLRSLAWLKGGAMSTALATRPGPKDASRDGGDAPRASTGAGGETLPLAWVPAHELDHRQWLIAGRKLARFTRCSQWWIGDWIRYGSAKWGEKYAEAIRVTGYDDGTLRNWAYVTSRFPLSLRSDKLSWSHHVLIAPLATIGERRAWLERVVHDKLTVEDLRIELRAARRAAEGQATAGGVPCEPAVEVAAAVSCPNCGFAIPAARLQQQASAPQAP